MACSSRPQQRNPLPRCDSGLIRCAGRQRASRGRRAARSCFAAPQQTKTCQEKCNITVACKPDYDIAKQVTHDEQLDGGVQTDRYSSVTCSGSDAASSLTVYWNTGRLTFLSCEYLSATRGNGR